VGAPDASLPDWGQLFCTVECSACASPEYEGRGGEQWSSELAGFLDRSLRPLPSESNNLQVEPRHHGIDLGQLKIITGKTCWNLYVDALVLNDDGNVLGALSLAALAALSDTKIPRVSILAGENGEEPEIELDDDPESSERLDLKYASAIVSVCQIGSALVVDLTAQEEECSRSTLHIAVNRQGMMCGMSKEGAFGIDPSSMIVALEVASKIGGQLTVGIANFQ
jgi:exosome complex component RRP42